MNANSNNGDTDGGPGTAPGRTLNYYAQILEAHREALKGKKAYIESSYFPTNGGNVGRFPWSIRLRDTGEVIRHAATYISAQREFKRLGLNY